MELGEWVCGRIIENLHNRRSDNRGSTVSVFGTATSLKDVWTLQSKEGA